MRKTVFKIANPTRTSVAKDKPPVEIEFKLEKKGEDILLVAACERLTQSVLRIKPGKGIDLICLYDGSIDYKITEALGTVYGEPARVRR